MHEGRAIMTEIFYIICEGFILKISEYRWLISIVFVIGLLVDEVLSNIMERPFEDTKNKEPEEQNEEESEE